MTRAVEIEPAFTVAQVSEYHDYSGRRDLEPLFEACLGRLASTKAAVLDTDFSAWLTGEAAECGDDIKQRERIMEAYDAFAPTVVAIKADRSPEALAEIGASFLFSGSTMDGYRFQYDGGHYALKLPHDAYRRTDPPCLNKYLTGLMRGLGATRMEQIQAIGFEDRAIVSKYLAGVPLEKAPPELLEQVDERLVSDLLQTLSDVAGRRIVLDINSPGNNLLDADSGFGFVDYGASRATDRSYHYLTNTSQLVDRVCRQITGDEPLEERCAPRDAAARLGAAELVLRMAADQGNIVTHGVCERPMEQLRYILSHRTAAAV